MVPLLLGSVIFILVLCKLWRTQYKTRLPPGPKGLPLIGNVLQLDYKRFSLQMCHFAKMYGDVHTISVFQTKFVILNSYDLIKKVMASVDTAGHPPSFLGKYVVRDDLIFQPYTEQFQLTKKIVLRGLSQCGASIPRITINLLDNLLSRIEKDSGKSVDPFDYFTDYLTMLFITMFTGCGTVPDQGLLTKCVRLTQNCDLLTNPVLHKLMTMFPCLRHIPVGGGRIYQCIMKDFGSLQRIVQEMNKNRDDKERISFVDYLENEKNKGNIGENVPSSVMLDLFIAGISATRSVLRSLFLVLATKPGIQTRIQTEVENQMTDGYLPSSRDKTIMPFTWAVIYEVLRLYPPVPLQTPHYTNKDMKVGDYIIPKNTELQYNIWYVQHDDTFWNNPWDFVPSRFLDESGQLVPRDHENRQRILTFGTGRRACVGETIAMNRIFVTLVAILHKYNVAADDVSLLPAADPRSFEVAIFLSPPRYKIHFEKRGKGSERP